MHWLGLGVHLIKNKINVYIYFALLYSEQKHFFFFYILFEVTHKQ